MVALAPAPTLRLARWVTTAQRSMLRQMIAVVSQPGILSFAGGLPDPALFPTAEYAAALTQVLAEDRLALQYRPPYAPLKAQIVALMAERGVICRPEQVFLTTGAQQALDVLTRLFLNAGETVALESVVYTGMQQALGPFQPRLLALPTDLATGLDVDALEAALASGVRPAFLYVIPDGHNPLGVSLSLEKRYRLVELARRYAFPIIEDDPYGFLAYTPEGNLPPLRAFDEDCVFYVGSFSKIIAPALRLGWLIAPESLTSKLTVIKEASDLESSGLTQRAVSAYVAAGHLPEQIARLRAVYGERREVMLAALERWFPDSAEFTTPSAGMFIWVALDPALDTTRLLEIALAAEKVAFIPGQAFAVQPDAARHCLRLNFTNCATDQIDDGIARLGRLFRRALAHPAAV